MARPPHLEGPVPTVTADWQWSGEWLVTTDAILTGAWRIPQDGKVVLLFANVSDSPYAGRLDLDPADYGLVTKAPTFTAIQPNAGRGDTCVAHPLAIEAIDHADVELPARTILAWEVQPAAGR